MKNQVRRQKLLAAAEHLFVSRGFDAVSTTDIAAEAGCNHALIHYYFGNKEQLFRQLFLDKIEQILQLILPHINADKPVVEKIDDLVDAYFEVLQAHPQLPFFIINELTLNAERRRYMRENFFLKPITAQVYQQVEQLLDDEYRAGRIVKISPENLGLDVISLTAFHFISMPAYRDLLSKDDAAVADFCRLRKEEIKTVIHRRLMP